uniref:Proteasome subunit beta n=1 Tax=Cacopsylla melanoneura TaxID=428564 RepID=A0A8D8R241_9HEMI
MFSDYSAPPMWQNGPALGKYYDFPNVPTNKVSHNSTNGKQRYHTPLTTGTSVLGLVFNGGVILAADTAGFYGSMMRFNDCPRIFQVNKYTILGAGNDYADIQYLNDIIKQKILDDDLHNDGIALKPKSLHCWLTRVLYNRRSKFDPLWINAFVAGMQNGEPFLGTVDKLGTAYEDKILSFGFGTHISVPYMRQEREKNPNMTKEEAVACIKTCMDMLYVRDARSGAKYNIGVITNEGSEILGPFESVGQWNIATHGTPGQE